ncbi:zinc finger protein 771-like [Bolinopsis microptera]|uniref:zinc finger protein 771-like n=1 Tax=Bolinopsis microptera TaxID=2820187 RepID=UPI003078AB30
MSLKKREKFEGVDIKEEMIDVQPVNPTSTRSSLACTCKCIENDENNKLMKAEAVLCNQFEAGLEHLNQVGEVVKMEDDRIFRDILAKAEPLDYKELQCDNCNLALTVTPTNVFNVRPAKRNSSSVPIPTESDCGIQAETLSIAETTPSGTEHKLKKQKQTHTGEKHYSCSLCDYKSSRSGALARHKRTHTGEKPYSCSLCDYKSSQSGALATHKRTHTGEKPYSCSLCDYKFNQSSHLASHERTHTGDKPYSCRLCDYKSYRSRDLARHKRTHTGEKPYSCSLCDYKSNQSSHLASHERTHTGEKPYSCSLCDYKTSHSSTLARHKRAHSGEKPYSCSLCDYKSNQLSNITAHKRTHTGDKPYCAVLSATLK